MLFSLKRPRISENFNVDVGQQRIIALSGFSYQMFVFLQESSDLFEQRHDQCFQIEEVILVGLINQGRRGPLDFKLGIVHSTRRVLGTIAIVRIFSLNFV